jgi:hypothetical protein
MCCIAEDIFLRKIDFGGSTTSYTNKLMKGMRYRLIRDKDAIMQPDVEWIKKDIGGFDLVGFEMADDTVIVIQFY